MLFCQNMAKVSTFQVFKKKIMKMAMIITSYYTRREFPISWSTAHLFSCIFPDGLKLLFCLFNSLLLAE